MEHSIHASTLKTMSGNIVWSAESCSLKTFVDSYTLPQLVKVEEGFYSEDDTKTLSAGQTLMLHSVTKVLVFVEAADHKQYFVPLNCHCKVEILPRICQDRYYSVEEVVDAWTSVDFKFIRVVEVHSHSPSLRIRAGDILKLKTTVEQNHVKFLECVFYGETEYLVKLPLHVKAVLEPLARKESYPFQEVLHSFEFPVRVKFKSNCKTLDTNNNIDLQSRGSVLLKTIRRESKIIATSRDDAMVPVLMIPTDLDVDVFPAHGAVVGDKQYARFCKEIHDSTNLSKVDLFENGSRLCECFEDPAEVAIHDYEAVELLPSQTIQDAQRLSKPKPAYSKQALSGMLSQPHHQNIRGGEHVLTTSNENPSNASNDQAPPRPPRVKSLPQSKPLTPPMYPTQALSSSARLNQPQHQSIRGEYLLTTSNENPSNIVDNQAPPRLPRVESLPHSNDTGANTDDDYHHYDEISSTGRNSNPVLSLERYHMDNDSERAPKRRDKLHQSKSSKRNSQTTAIPNFLKTTVPKAPSSLSGRSQRGTNAAVSPQRPSLTRPLSEASLSVSSSDAVFLGPESSTQDLPRESFHLKEPIPKQSILPTPSSVPSCLEHSHNFPAENVCVESSPVPSILSNSLSASSVFSQDLKGLSVSGVGECIRKLNMGRYAAMFERNRIDGQLLMELDLESFSHLGVRNPLHQKKLVKFINGWRPNTN